MDTKELLIDVAEKHFATNGFAGTSLRGIIKDAKVNVASIAYHFGTKEELYGAVIERFAAPVVAEQMLRLKECLSKEARVEDVRVEDVLYAFYEPPIKLIKMMGDKGATLSLFLGRAQTESSSVSSLRDAYFADCRNAFLDAFRILVPGLTEADYHWRFEFMLSLIVCFLTRNSEIQRRYSKEADWQIDEVVSRLVAFCGPGIKAKLPNNCR